MEKEFSFGQLESVTIVGSLHCAKHPYNKLILLGFKQKNNDPTKQHQKYCIKCYFQEWTIRVDKCSYFNLFDFALTNTSYHADDTTDIPAENIQTQFFYNTLSLEMIRNIFCLTSEQASILQELTEYEIEQDQKREQRENPDWKFILPLFSTPNNPFEIQEECIHRTNNKFNEAQRKFFLSIESLQSIKEESNKQEEIDVEQLSKDYQKSNDSIGVNVPSLKERTPIDQSLTQIIIDYLKENFNVPISNFYPKLQKNIQSLISLLANTQMYQHTVRHLRFEWLFSTALFEDLILLFEKIKNEEGFLIHKVFEKPEEKIDCFGNLESFCKSFSGEFQYHLADIGTLCVESNDLQTLDGVDSLEPVSRVTSLVVASPFDNFLQQNLAIAIKCPHLKILHFDGLISDDAEKIKDVILSFPKLTQIKLDLNTGEKGASTFFSAFQKSPSLTQLTLNYKMKFFYGLLDCASTFTDLSNCVQISNLSLNLKQVKSNDNSITQLSSMITALINLRFLTLNLSETYLQRKQRNEVMQNAIQTCKQLVYLNFEASGNFITDEIEKKYLEAFSSCSKILQLKLDFSFNEIQTNKNRQKLRGTLKSRRLVDLQYLDFSDEDEDDDDDDDDDENESYSSYSYIQQSDSDSDSFSL